MAGQGKFDALTKELINYVLGFQVSISIIGVT